MKLTPLQRTRAGLLGVAFGVVGDTDISRTCFRAAFAGQWEGWEQNRSRNRPGKRIVSQDVDLNFGVREQLLSEARSLEQTFPIAKSIKEKYAEYCVGRCNIRWNTGNPDHDSQYRNAWKVWMKIADAKGIHSFPKLARLSVAGAFSEGDTFIQKVDAKGYAQINLIEADRVSSGGIYNNDTPDMIGGIGIFNGRPSHIRVWERTIYGLFVNPVEIPAAEYCHLFFTSRADAYRGVTGFHAVLNAMRDMKEIDAAERLKTKRNSKLALIAKVITGQAPPGASNIDLIGEGFKDAGPQKVTVEDVGEAATWYGFPSEDIKSHESNTPSTTWQGHMEFIIRNIAIGSNLPFGVVWSMAGLGKPAILTELEQASRTFRGIQDETDDKLIRPIAGWWLAKEIANNRLPFNPNWYKFRVGRPADISIDAGRDSKAALAENLMAMRSATSWYNETEDDFEEETERCFEEEAFRMKMADKWKVDMTRVRQTTPNGNANAIGDSNKQSESE